MTLAKRFLLGSAAALVATTGAQAADLGLPVAPAVDYVQICSIGSFTGFLLPGSNVCFDISGEARFEANFGDESQTTWIGSTGRVDRDELSFNGEFALNFDARTMTEFGLLRGFISMDSEERNDGADVEFEQAFVQLGGLVAGLTSSFFDPLYSDYALVGGFGGDDDIALIGYNFAFGNGFTLGVSLEDAESRQRDPSGGSDAQDREAARIIAAAGLAAGDAANAALNGLVGYDDSYTTPDLAIALRVAQAWGGAAVYGAVRDIDPEAHLADNEMGYAIGASAEINLPFGFGSTFGVLGTYASGMIDYVDINGHDFTVNNAGTGLELSTAYLVGAGFDIGVTEQVSVQLEGSYFDFDATLPSATFGADDVDAADYSGYSIRGSVAYVPVDNLTIAAGVFYQSFDYDNALAADITEDDSDFGGRFRITRSF